MFDFRNPPPRSVFWRMRIAHGVIALSVVALVLTVASSLDDIATRERSLTREAIPALARAADANRLLSETLEKLEALRDADDLKSLEERRDVGLAAISRLKGIAGATATDGADPEAEGETAVALSDMRDAIETLYALSVDRVTAKDRLNALTIRRRGLIAQMSELTQSWIASARGDVEQALDATAPGGRAVDDALAERIRRLMTASDLVATLKRIASAAEAVDDTGGLDRLDGLRAELEADLGTKASLFGEDGGQAGDAQSRQIIEGFAALRSLLLPKDGALDMRRRWLKAQGAFAEEWRAALSVSARLVARSNATVVAANAQIGQTAAAVETTIGSTWTALIISAISAFAVIAVVLFILIENQIVARLSRLSAAVREIAAGRDDHPVAVSGQDELGEMAEALEVFKRNAQDLRHSNAALAKVQAEREIAAVDAGLRLVLDTATNGIVALDSEGRVVIANPVARHMLGGVSAPTPFDWPAEIAFLDAVDLSPVAAGAGPLEKALGGGRLRDHVLAMTRAKGGAHRYVRISTAPVQDPDAALQAVLVIDDISEQQTHRQQIERRARLDALGQLTGGIAHDFNNLLATVQSSVQLAMRLPASETDRLLGGALASIRRGADLTRRLLTFAKLQPAQARSRAAADVVSDLVSIARPTIESTIAIEAQGPDAELMVFCDQGQLDNALLNLVLNARDAILRSGRGDRITVAVRGLADLGPEQSARDPHAYPAGAVQARQNLDRSRQDGLIHRFVEIAVTDNGPGMSEEVQRRAIDPFFTTKGTNSGTGLGLSMVYGFVQQAGGELRIYSEEGRGSTIRLLLPRGDPAGGRETAAPQGEPLRGRGERILLVEDEAALLEVMAETLSYLGYQPQTATSGREALSRAEDGLDFDLLLTDVVMPGGVGGFELARRLREQRPDLPVIYMSGYTGFASEEMGAVVAPLLPKPCEPVELAQAVRAALDAQTPPA